ncbi:MAG TPA: beta-ketoacyl-ACP reductase [Baekduia sp.]|nr:beta-ketoacyl-ACP reductase [Baekduia sp.]
MTQLLPTPDRVAAAPLAGHTALVTGGSRGIGRAIALDLACAGATVVATYRADDEAARRLESVAVDGPGSIVAQRCDVAAGDACARVVAELVAEHGRLDILINNAGMTADASAVRMSDAQWDVVLDVNLSGPFRLARLALPHMLEAGGGRIINIASVVGQRGNIGQANYAAAKAGMVGLTKTLARETAFALGRADGIAEPRGLTVNAIAPGFIATDMLAPVPDRVLDRIVGQIPAGRLGQPEEIARVARFLCEDASAYITGQTWHVNGGMTM